MTRKLMLASAITAALTGHPALALELGALRTESALNQPFQGEIDLGDIGPDELDALRVSIAPPEVFEKAKIERYYYLTQLRFTPEVTANGRVRVRVSSQDPVREPYLDFLVEAVWPAGRLVKGYTVLLDPPAQTERRAPNVQTARAGSAVSGPDRSLPPVASGSGTYIPAPGEGFPLYIGPVGGGEGLWSLARRHATAGASDAQTAMALYRSNQEAFVRGNINRLIAGKTLVIPSHAELFALDTEEARRELQAALNGRPAQRAPLTDVTPEMLSRLRLVGATPGAAAPTPRPGAAPATSGTGVQSPDVLLAIETSESARQEALELRNRIQELESQLADIQSLLQVRNAELARAQSAETQTSELAIEPASDSQFELEPIEAPDSSEPQPGTLAQDSVDALEPAPAATSLPTAVEPSDLQFALTEEPLEAREPASDMESERLPEPSSGLDSMPDSTESASAIGLVPVPTPAPVAPETPDEASTGTPVSQVAAESVATPTTPQTPLPVVEPKAAEPTHESPSTWHSLLLPLAGIAGVTALGILLFSLVTVRRRRQEQEDEIPEDDIESDLVLDRLSDLDTEAESGRTSHAAEASDVVSLSKTKPARQTPVQPVSAPAVPDLDDTNEEVVSSLTGFDAETDEADVLSEADIYIAYGRHREACDLLNKELKRYPQRLDIKYKLAEALAASGETEALRELLDEIRSSGGDTEQPDQWERMQQRLRELAPNAPLAPATPSLTPSAVAAASAGLGLAVAASEALESLTVPELEPVVESGSEEDLLLDLGDFAPPASEDSDFKPADDSLKLELDSGAVVPAVEEIEQAIEGDIDSILPLSEASQGLDLDLGVFDATSASAAQAPAAFEAPVGDMALDLNLEIPLLDDSLGDLDLTIDDLGVADALQMPPKSPILGGEPSDKDEESLEALDSSLSPEQESVPSDLLSSQWQIDSGIWDETATKLDLARAYVEMDDKEAAREILEEVMAEGREEQRNEARAMLERLGG
jgi:pilus assembly protein FimV